MSFKISVTFIQYPLGINLGIDEFLFKEGFGSTATLYPGRIAGSTAICLILISISLLITGNKYKWGTIAAQLLAITTALLSLLPQFGYAYNEEDLFTFAYKTPMALNTAITLLTLSIGLLFLKPTSGILKILGSEGFGSSMAKRSFPVIVLLPILMTWASLIVRAGGYNLKTIDSEVLIIIYMVIFILTFSRIFVSLNKAEDELKKSERKYRKIFENVQDIYYQIDTDELITELSPSIFRVAGYRREELIGKSASALYSDLTERDTLMDELSKKERFGIMKFV